LRLQIKMKRGKKHTVIARNEIPMTDPTFLVKFGCTS